MITAGNPNVGMTNTYTSGCPKNQNRCCDKIESPPYEKSRNDVCQCRSSSIIIMAAAKTGVIGTNRRSANSNPIDTNGNNTRLFFNPEVVKMRRVTNKFVNDIVVLIPATITDIKRMSCDPTPVNLISDENGVINVHPLVVNVEFEHRTTNVFSRLSLAA
jgi:hypothetical protein